VAIRILADQINLSNGAGLKDSLIAVNGGATTLYYDNAAKIATTNTGVDVTGEVQADSLDIDGNGDVSGDLVVNGQLMAVNGVTRTTANTQDALVFTTGEGLMKLNARGSIRYDVDNNANGTGQYHEFTSNDGGGSLLKMQDNSGIVFNETSQDLDFRVESDNNTHAFFVNAGGTRIGMGSTDNATAHLNIQGDIGGGYGGMVRMENSGTDGCMGFIGVTDTNWGIGSGKLIIGRGAQGDNTSSALVELTIGSSGYVFNENSNDRDFRVESDSNTHALFVDAGNNSVGIGASTVTKAKLNIKNGGVDGTYENVLAFQYSDNANENNIIGSTVSSTAGNSGIFVGITDGGGASTTKNMLQITRGAVIVNQDSVDADFRVESDLHTHAFFVDASNGNVLIKGSDSSVANTGFAYEYASDYIKQTSNGGPCLYLNRRTSDGTIQEFRKDNTNVGRIGVENNDLTIGTGDTGLQFRDASDAIRPFNISTNAARDANIDLGRSTERFRSLFLSGGVYLGGTGSANLLDDYEEGTWTPEIRAATTDPTVTYATRLGAYVIIGNTVYISFYIYCSAGNVTGGSGNIQIGNLPVAIRPNGGYSSFGLPFIPAGYVFTGGASQNDGSNNTMRWQANSTPASKINLYSSNSTSHGGGAWELSGAGTFPIA
jgi:hypothetical protein